MTQFLNRIQQAKTSSERRAIADPYRLYATGLTFNSRFRSKRFLNLLTHQADVARGKQARQPFYLAGVGPN